MKATKLSLAFLLSALAPIIGAEPPDAAQDLAARLTELAAKIPYLNRGDVIYQRLPSDAQHLMDAEEFAAVRAFEALTESAPEPQLWKLTQDPNPRLRTLALIGTYWWGNPQRLPGFVELMNDSATTFPEIHSEASMLPSRGPFKQRREQVGLKECTVADYAKSIVGAYLRAADTHYRPEDGSAQRFLDYWAERRERTECLSWLELALGRATHGTTPLQKQCLPAVQRLKERVAALAPPYRGWILLSLVSSSIWGNHEEDRAHLASEDEVIHAAQEIGAPTLLRLFRGELVSDDPDLRIESHGPFPYGGVCRRLLRRAAQIFQPADAETLLALEEFHRQWERREDALVTSSWAIAAADLAPARAREILLAAFGRFQDERGFSKQEQRRELAQAFWQHEGARDLDVPKDWFFGETPERGAFGFGRHGFAQWLAHPEQRPLLVAIVKDRRLDDLDWSSLTYLVRAANQSSAKPIISEDELRLAWHPLGEGSYHFLKEEAARKYPKETAQLEASLAQWKKKLRAAFPD